MCSSSSTGDGKARHTTYRFGEAVVAYRFHPLFGKRVPIIRRIGHGDDAVVHVDVDVPFSRELPAWMCDAVICARMERGAPVVPVAVLRALREVLDASTVDAVAGPAAGATARVPTAEAMSHGRASTHRSPTVVGLDPGSPGATPPLVMIPAAIEADVIDAFATLLLEAAGVVSSPDEGGANESEDHA